MPSGAGGPLLCLLVTSLQCGNFLLPDSSNVLSGGGINKAGQWVKEKRVNGNYLYPKDAMQKIYKAYFLKMLQQLMQQQKLAHINLLGTKQKVYIV